MRISEPGIFDPLADEGVGGDNGFRVAARIEVGRGGDDIDCCAEVITERPLAVTQQGRHHRCRDRVLQSLLAKVRAPPGRTDRRGIGQRSVHIEQHRTQHALIIASRRDLGRNANHPRTVSKALRVSRG